MTTTAIARRAWHPITGAVLVAAVAVAALVWRGAGAGPGASVLVGFLAMGAVAGFSVSGST